jgi:hypothetical protein
MVDESCIIYHDGVKLYEVYIIGGILSIFSYVQGRHLTGVEIVERVLGGELKGIEPVKKWFIENMLRSEIELEKERCRNLKKEIEFAKFPAEKFWRC